MRTEIYYYSGTGNSLASSRQLSNILGDAKVIPINMDIKHIETERLIFIIPCYAYGMPDIVLKFFKSVFIKADYIAFLSTCGSVPGGIFFQAKKLLKKKGLKLDYISPIKTVDNYFAIFKRCTIEEELILIDNQAKIVDQIGNEIMCLQKTSKIKRRIFGRMINKIFRIGRPLINKAIKINKECVGCGKCVKNCQVQAIRIEGNKAKIDTRKCQNCQGCINICPCTAINFLKVKKHVRRYIHPNMKENGR